MTRDQHAAKAVEFAHSLYDMQDYGKSETMGETIRRVIDDDDYDEVVAAAHHGRAALQLRNPDAGKLDRDQVGAAAPTASGWKCGPRGAVRQAARVNGSATPSVSGCPVGRRVRGRPAAAGGGEPGFGK